MTRRWNGGDGDLSHRAKASGATFNTSHARYAFFLVDHADPVVRTDNRLWGASPGGPDEVDRRLWGGEASLILIGAVRKRVHSGIRARSESGLERETQSCMSMLVRRMLLSL